jgi:hypothetical protein
MFSTSFSICFHQSRIVISSSSETFFLFWFYYAWGAALINPSRGELFYWESHMDSELILIGPDICLSTSSETQTRLAYLALPLDNQIWQIYSMNDYFLVKVFSSSRGQSTLVRLIEPHHDTDMLSRLQQSQGSTRE